MDDPVNDEEQHQRQVREAMLSRRNLLVAGTGLGVAGLATGILGAAPAAGTPSGSGADAPVVRGSGPFGTSAPAAPAAGAPTPDVATPTLVPGATARTVVAEGFNPAFLGSGSTLVGVFTPVWGAYNSTGGALVGPARHPHRRRPQAGRLLRLSQRHQRLRELVAHELRQHRRRWRRGVDPCGRDHGSRSPELLGSAPHGRAPGAIRRRRRGPPTPTTSRWR